MNSVSLMGRVGQPPEVKVIQGGKEGTFKVCNNLSIAVRRNADVTDWVNCKVIGKSAEILEKYVLKGDMIGIDGSLQVESWEKDGKKNSKLIVSVNRIHLLPNGKDKTNSGSEVIVPEIVENIPF